MIAATEVTEATVETAAPEVKVAVTEAAVAVIAADAEVTVEDVAAATVARVIITDK